MAASAPLIAVDIGNTSIDVAKFSAGGVPREPQLLWSCSSHEPDFAGLAAWVPKESCRWVIAQVYRAATAQLTKWLAEHRPGDPYKILKHHDLPLRIEVDRPDLVGVDRLVAAVAANELRNPNQPAIIVDVGTAITVDAVSDGGAFLGGLILPGPSMAFSALAAADLLPHVGWEADAEPPPVIAKSTEQAIRGGVFWATVGGIREIISHVQAALGAEPLLLITGGKAERLTPYIQPNAIFRSGLVLLGVALSAPRPDSNP